LVWDNFAPLRGAFVDYCWLGWHATYLKGITAELADTIKGSSVRTGRVRSAVAVASAPSPPARAYRRSAMPHSTPGTCRPSFGRPRGLLDPFVGVGRPAHRPNTPVVVFPSVRAADDDRSPIPPDQADRLCTRRCSKPGTGRRYAARTILGTIGTGLVPAPVATLAAPMPICCAPAGRPCATPRSSCGTCPS
jgi:hypothetical protein